MTVLSQAEFKQQSSVGNNSLEKIYQGKALEEGPIFSLANLTAAKLYCARFKRKKAGAACIIVEEQSFLRIWSEIIHNEKDVNSNSDSSAKDNEREITVNGLPVTSEFRDFCQKLLAESIGPIAKTICKKTLAKHPYLSRQEFVEILAKKISDPQQAQQFRQATLD